jgi:DegV family protein with EDD domain
VIRVVTDSSCDLPDELIRNNGIEVVPLTIRFGDQALLDRVDLSAAQFWERLRTGDTLPQTSAPAPGQFRTVFERLFSHAADGIVVVSLSSRLSGTFEAARNAARDMDEVVVIDSFTATAALGFQVIEAAREAQRGADLPTVERRARAAATGVVAALDTLEFLRRGGRIGPAAAFLGAALQIKPLIELKGGAVVPAGRVRTRSKSLAFIARRLAELGPTLEELAIVHADARDEAEKLASELDLSCSVLVSEIGPVIGTHTGPGTIGAAYRVRSTRR